MNALNSEQATAGIVAKNSQEYIELVYQCFSQGSVAVTLRSDNDQERIAAAGIKDISTPGETTGWIEIPNYDSRAPDEIAQLLFTSGTEGKPKGIILEHGALANTTARLISIMEITADIREYIGVPVYYSFGFGRARVVSSAGGKAYLPPNGFSPTEIADMLSRNEINALSAVPTLLRLLLLESDLFADCGKQLRWLEIGSQYMSADEKSQLCRLFPNAKIIQHYGLTEASRTTFLRIHDAQEQELESVGRCVDGTDIRISTEGIIQIRGPHVAKSMIQDGKLLPLTNDGWLTTTDAGHITDGNLYFEGRADDIINCGGIKLSPETLQSALNNSLNTSQAICVTRIDDEFRGDNVLVAYKKDANIDLEQLKQATHHHLEQMGIRIGSAAQFFEVDEFPTTETGKIQRKQLAKQFQESAVAETNIAEDSEPASEESPVIAKLISAWEETLKIKPVSQHDSFFDLGGDSLSAIRLSVKMEKMGFSKAVCQEIFRGKTIAEIANAEQGESGSGETTAQLVSLWEETLKIKPVSEHDSFFDLGGDSLSAIRLTVKMEKMGFSKELCQEVFRGRTIAEIAGMNANKGSKEKKSILSGASKAIDIVRGVLVLLVVASHWVPGVVERLPEVVSEYNRYLAPLYSAGTPGFAMIFGLGIGFFVLGRYQKHPDSIRPLVILNASLLGGGVFLMALIGYLELLLSGKPYTAVTISNLFWNVIFYYLVAILTLPLWLKFIDAFQRPAIACLSLALILFATHILIDDLIAPQPSDNPLIQTLILLGTAKYNYFEMSAGALLGASAGIAYRALVNEAEQRGEQALGSFASIGILLVVLSIILSHEMGTSHMWFIWPKELFIWTWLCYLGAIMVAINLLYNAVHNDNLSPIFEVPLNITATIGTMAFPIFIGHELVIPLKEVLSELGVPLALPISLALFFLPSIYYIHKLYNLYYGSRKASVDHEML